MMWNVASSTTFFKIKYIYIYIFFVGGLFCTVESRFFELDGKVANYEDSRYCGGNIKYKIHQI